jgi:hypothetical protein
MPTRFERLVTIASSSHGASKATPEMIELQCLSATAILINFFRPVIIEDDHSLIYPSTLVLMEAPSGSGKNAIHRFVYDQVFGFPVRFCHQLLANQEEQWIIAESKAVTNRIKGEDYDEQPKTEKIKRDKLVEKALIKLKASKRPLDSINFDDGSYEGFAFDRAYMAQFRLGSKAVKSEEFGDRLVVMMRSPLLQTLYGRLFELIDYDRLGAKSIKSSEGMTPGSEGMATDLYLTMASIDLSVKDRVKKYILNTIGRRGFLLKVTNSDLSYIIKQGVNSDELENLQKEIADLTEFLASHLSVDDEGVDMWHIDLSGRGRAYLSGYRERYAERLNKLYSNGVESEDKDLECALLQDLDRKVLRVACLMSIFNSDLMSWPIVIDVDDLKAAVELVERTYDNAKDFFDGSRYTHSNRLISYLKSVKGDAWVSAKELLDNSLFPMVNPRGYQDAIREIMMRDIAIALQSGGENLEHRVYNKQDQYRVATMDADDDFLAALADDDSGDGVYNNDPKVAHKFSWINGLSPANREGYKVHHNGDAIGKAMAKDICYSAIEWQGGVRNQDNFISANLVILDFDENVTLSSIHDTFKDYKFITATTKSHQIKKGDKPAEDRFRLVLFSDVDLKELDEFKRVMQYMVEKFNADRACKDGARFYYGHSGSVVNVNQGRLFPVAKILSRLDSIVDNKADSGQVHLMATTGGLKSNGKEKDIMINVPRVGMVGAVDFISGLPIDSKNTVPVKCPWHDDGTASAFVSHNDNGGLQLSCSVCDRTVYF